MVGYTLAYNTLDNNKNPTAGIYAEFKQDFAGVGGDVNFIRTTADARSYYEMFSDVVAVLHLQGGNIAGWGGKDLRMLDHFQMGPNLVRGFAPSGLGPRDSQPIGHRLRRSARRHHVLGRQPRGAGAVHLPAEGGRAAGAPCSPTPARSGTTRGRRPGT